MFEINAYRFASVIFSTTLCIAYLVWNANRVFISSTKLQHNVIIKGEINRVNGCLYGTHNL
jgi:hypothetical protein